jgi:hypothetical protein
MVRPVRPGTGASLQDRVTLRGAALILALYGVCMVIFSQL